MGFPPCPKKPLTPYFRFLRDNREQIKKQNPSLASIDLVKKCAEIYKDIDENIHSRYIKEYEKDRENYLKQRLEYETKLTADQRQCIADAKQAKVEKKKRVAHKKVRILLHVLMP